MAFRAFRKDLANESHTPVRLNLCFAAPKFRARREDYVIVAADPSAFRSISLLPCARYPDDRYSEPLEILLCHSARFAIDRDGVVRIDDDRGHQNLGSFRLGGRSRVSISPSGDTTR